MQDVAEAVHAVAATKTARGVYNLGSGRAIPVREVVERIRDCVDPSRPLGFGELAYRPDQVMHLEADITRLKRDTGWSPSTSLADGIERTVRWYREQFSRYEPQ